jgi:predicted ATPase
MVFGNIVSLIDESNRQSTEINFLVDLASDRRLKKLPFVIIGAYRDVEVGPKHPLAIGLELMKLNAVHLYTIEVLPFTGQELHELLFEIIGTATDGERLAEILLQKSEGSLVLYLEVSISYYEAFLNIPVIELHRT